MMTAIKLVVGFPKTIKERELVKKVVVANWKPKSLNARKLSSSKRSWLA